MGSDKAMLHTQYSGEELLANKPDDQGIPTTCSILAYEVGDLVKGAMHVHWGEHRGYKGEAHKGIADAITILRLLCVLLNLDFWKAMRDGEEAYMSRESIKHTRGLPG